MSDGYWSHLDTAWVQGRSIVGYDVICTDGWAGHIARAAGKVDPQWLVVETGYWPFRRTHLVPAEAATRVDHEENSVTVALTRDQIKLAPVLDKNQRNPRLTAP